MTDQTTKIISLHNAYMSMTGLNVPLSFDKQGMWHVFIQREFTEDDLRLTIAMVLKRVDKVTAMRIFRFTRFIGNIEQLSEDIAEARALARVPKPTEKDRVLEQSGRPKPVRDTSKPVRDVLRANAALAELIKLKESLYSPTQSVFVPRSVRRLEIVAKDHPARLGLFQRVYEGKTSPRQAKADIRMIYGVGSGSTFQWSGTIPALAIAARLSTWACKAFCWSMVICLAVKRPVMKSLALTTNSSTCGAAEITAWKACKSSKIVAGGIKFLISRVVWVTRRRRLRSIAEAW
jgi:hypothetical protein